ncbi:hypothetical protein LCGC14_2451870 [marine sediment metagenome]|uniref:10 kDa chaperonin n=1 Tax=marine sediment metagenome TaxID=412755 RepID=A0A0F9C3F7_9ZZZZ
MKITPRNALVTVRMFEPRKDTKIGGIYIPSTHGAQFKMAEVVEVGRGTPEYNALVGTDDLRAGQTVLVKAGQQIDIGQSVQSYVEIQDGEGNDLALMNQHDIMAIIGDTNDDSGTAIPVD